MLKKICASIMLFMVVGASNASLISVSELTPVTQSGELLNFKFDSLPPSDGNGGLFNIILNGDYSPRNPPPLAEGVTVSFNGVSGILELYNQSSNPAILSNTITGLSLNTSSISGGGNTVNLAYLFDISGALLNSILMDGSIEVSVQNTDDVNPFGDHFIQVVFEYNSGDIVMPASAPSIFVLLTLALGGLIHQRRK